jgi:hypothetical protein
MSSLVFIRHCLRHLEYVQDTSQLSVTYHRKLFACTTSGVVWNFFLIFLTLSGTFSWEQTVGVGQVEAAQRSQLQQNMLTYTWGAVHSVLPASHVAELLRLNVVPNHSTRALCSLCVKSTIFPLLLPSAIIGRC